MCRKTTANTFIILRYPFGFPLAFVTISNNEISEIDANDSPRKPKTPQVASVSAKLQSFDVAADTGKTSLGFIFV